MFLSATLYFKKSISREVSMYTQYIHYEKSNGVLSFVEKTVYYARKMKDTVQNIIKVPKKCARDAHV
jgi:hypothetical protein